MGQGIDEHADGAARPLAGVRVVEFAGIGPAPYCGQLLRDLGATVLVLDRPSGTAWRSPVVERGKERRTVDLATDAGRADALATLDGADVLIEGFRPGAMERLGLGPEVVCPRYPRLIYGRMTGWGQGGPLARTAGHDITYLALTGALAAMGPADGPPMPPLNLVGDFGGGSLFLAFGISAALFERERSGEGRVIDAAIVDGAASMMSFFAGLSATGALSMERDLNPLAGANPFYRCYECADGRYVAVGALEPHFRAELLRRIDAPAGLADAPWRDAAADLTRIFAGRPRDAWAALLEGTDACLAPVLTLAEAPAHPHLAARATFTTREGALQPAPAPRLSRSSGCRRHDSDPKPLSSIDTVCINGGP